MKILKCLWGNPIAQLLENKNLQVHNVLNRGYNIKNGTKEAKRRITILSKADKKANAKIKAPMRSNELSVIQDKLWNIGAFKNVTKHGKQISYEQAVDGMIGPLTRQALANARKMGYNFDGYNIDEKSGLITSKKAPTHTSKLEEEIVDPYTGMPMNIPIGYGDSNLGNGYSVEAIKPKNKSFFNRLYLFGYDNSKDSKKASLFVLVLNLYLPENLQIPVKETGQLYGASTKTIKGILGIDKAANAANEFADLNLSDPNLRLRAIELLKIMEQEEPEWGVRSGTLERKQKVIRGRYDLNLLHSGYPQKYNSYTINESFTPNGYKRAYVLSDPEMRLSYLNFITNFVKSNKPSKITDDGKKLYTVEGGDPYAQYGNFTIVTDSDGSNIRYIDDWDFGRKKVTSKYIPGMKEIIIADKVK